MLEEDSPRWTTASPDSSLNPDKEIFMFDQLTSELLDLTAESRGVRLAHYALNIDCCCCSCCWN